MPGKRFLAPARISRRTDESTSVDTQLEAVARYGQAYDLQLIPVVPDLDVSGAKPIREREGIGPWLTDDHLNDWDGIITYRLDRLFRSQADYVLFYEYYCEQRGKVIISTAEGIDTSTEVGNWMAMQLVGFAQMERGRMILRRRDAQTRLRAQKRWPGGKVLYPHEAYKDGAGWAKRLNPERTARVRYWAAEVLDNGRTCTSLTLETNRAGIRTLPTKRNPQGTKWGDGVILRLLRHPGLKGEIWHYPPYVFDPVIGKKVRPAPIQELDDDGMPLKYDFDPVLDEDTWNRLQAALDRNSVAATASRRRTSPLLGVAYCALCNTRLNGDRFEKRGQKRAIYRCPKRDEAKAGPGKTCAALSVQAELLEAQAAQIFLAQVGDTPIMTKITVPDNSRRAEVAAIGRQIRNLVDEKYGRGIVRPDYDAVMARLTRQHEELSAEPTRPPEISWKPTGRTFAEEWAERTEEGKRQLMLSAGFRLSYARMKDGGEIQGYQIDPGLAERARLVASGEIPAVPDSKLPAAMAPLQEMLRRPRLVPHKATPGAGAR